ncbi:MAG TPA: hypothetical protein VIL18_02120 [Longimicrobiales bacterium]
MRRRLATILLVLAPISACDDSTSPEGENGVFDFRFTTGTHGWTPGFADYPVGEEQSYQLVAGHEELPAPLDQSRRGILLSGNNHSDDLFMFLKRQLTGLQPETEYDVAISVEFATNAAQGCFGVGGSEGESVVIKAGASAVEPDTVVKSEGVATMVRFNLDKGNQLEPGADAIVLGNIANSSTDCGNAPYELKTLDSADQELTAKTDANGRLWLFVGSESGFEAKTALYYTRIRAKLTPRESDI